jgi:hypothetical protein
VSLFSHICLILHTEVFLMRSAELWPRLMELGPSNTHDILRVSQPTGSVDSGCALVCSYAALLEIFRSVLFIEHFECELCSKNRFILLISSKYTVVSFLCCMHLIILANDEPLKPATLQDMCLISPTKCCPNFALCEIRPIKVFASPFNKAEFIRYKWVQRNITHGRKTIRVW